MTDLNALREQAAEAARKYHEEVARAQRGGLGRLRDYVLELNRLYTEAQEFAQSIDMRVNYSSGYNEFGMEYGAEEWDSSNC